MSEEQKVLDLKHRYHVNSNYLNDLTLTTYILEHLLWSKLCWSHHWSCMKTGVNWSDLTWTWRFMVMVADRETEGGSSHVPAAACLTTLLWYLMIHTDHNMSILLLGYLFSICVSWLYVHTRRIISYILAYYVGSRIWTDINVLASNLTRFVCQLLGQTLCYPRILGLVDEFQK